MGVAVPTGRGVPRMYTSGVALIRKGTKQVIMGGGGGGLWKVPPRQILTSKCSEITSAWWLPILPLLIF